MKHPKLSTKKSYTFVGLSAVLAVLLLKPSAPQVEFQNPQPYPQISYRRIKQENPPQNIHVATVDLTNPKVKIRVVPSSADPDGDGPYQTTLQTLSTVAAREKFELMVNGDFFAAKPNEPGDGFAPGYVVNKWATVRGPAVTDGKLWAVPQAPRPALYFEADGKPGIGTFKEVPASVQQAIAGNIILLKDGQIPANVAEDKARHPRTIAGISQDGKSLVLAVIDGRRPGKSTGMTYMELAELMKTLGCHDALNLDGGGSTEMLLLLPKTQSLVILNNPSDGRERTVANALGVQIEP